MSSPYNLWHVHNVPDPKDDKVLLINRPDKLGFPGYLGPGGKVEFPESISEGAVREVLRRQD